MITTLNPLGSISLTNEYFAGLVAQATQSCYGVAAMSVSGTTDSLKSWILRGDNPEKGVRVTERDGKLVVELHIKVAYGLNIASIVASITHRVRNEVESATGLKVAHIDVCVDDILSE